MGHLVGPADGQQHVAGIQGAGGAGGAGGGADPLVVQQQEQALALDALEAEADVAGQPVLQIAVDGPVGDLGQARDELVPEGRHLRHGLGQLGHGLFQGGGHAHDAGQVLGAGPLAPLLSAALDEVGQDDALFGVEDANALGTVELVGGEGQKINVVFLHVDGDVAHSLDRVGVEENAGPAADGADLPDGLDGADLVVGVHDGDQAGLRRDGGLHLLGRHQTVAVDVQISDGEALFFQLLQGVEHGVVLKGRGDDVGLALPLAPGGHGANGLVVGLGAAGGEGDLPGVGRAQGRRHPGPGVGQGFHSCLAHGMQAGGVAVDLIHIGQHRPDRRLAHPGRGRVVCIDGHGMPP